MGAKTNELIAKHVHTRGFGLVYTCTLYADVILATVSKKHGSAAVGNQQSAFYSRVRVLYPVHSPFFLY